MYKEAIRKGDRFQTNVGVLTIEQLWQLSIEDLDTLAIKLEEEYNASGKKSFVRKRTAKDETLERKFEIVKDILKTKVQEEELATRARENKEHNSKILNMIANKQDEKLANMSIKELEKQLK